MDEKYLNFKKEIEKLIKELRSFFEKNSIYQKLEKHNKEMLMLIFGKIKQNLKRLLKKKNYMKILLTHSKIQSKN